MLISGKPASVAPRSRTANSSAIFSARSRRARNASARADASSNHCASSTTQSNERPSAASDIRPRTASPTRNGSGAGPTLRPNATARASRWGSGRRSVSSMIGEHSCWNAAYGSSISPSTPAVRTTPKSGASSTANSSKAVLPTPGSPCRTKTPPCPVRAPSRSRPSTSRSRSRPSSGGSTSLVTITSTIAAPIAFVAATERPDDAGVRTTAFQDSITLPASDDPLQLGRPGRPQGGEAA
jgi:hypothetical protein